MAHHDSGSTKEDLAAIETIKKKLVGQRLSYKEIYNLMDELSKERLSPVLTTYFVAAGFREGFTPTELFYLTKAMAETGKKLAFDGIVADKHSTGGLAGTRTTMILVPIIAAAGFLIPKNSSRAITTPAGTADTMEVLAPVVFPAEKIKKMVDKTGGCIVWGGHLGIAPADDVIIRVEAPLSFESFDKVIVSIMAKKVASGATHLVLDIPVGPTLKVHEFKDADVIVKKFTYLANKFGIKLVADTSQSLEPAGHAVGPALEARDVLKVLEQRVDRPMVLEAKTIRLAGRLLDLCYKDTKKKETESGEQTALRILKSGMALNKMKEIIKVQGGNPDVTVEKIEVGQFRYEMKSAHKGVITGFNNKDLTVISRILGCPEDKKAGIHLDKRIDQKVDKGDTLCTLFATSRWKLEEAKATLSHVPIYKVQ